MLSIQVDIAVVTSAGRRMCKKGLEKMQMKCVM